MSYARLQISLCGLLLLTGCGAGVAPTGAAKAALGGRMMGAQQPVAGATIQLYEVGLYSDGDRRFPC